MRSRRDVDAGLVRVGPLTGLAALVRDLGSDPEPVFRHAGFETEAFEDPDREIPFVPAGRLLAGCVTATGCGYLGLLLGERADPSALGVAGFMLRTAPDVDAALRGLARHLELHDQGGDIVLRTSGDVTLFGYVIHIPGVAGTDQIYDLSIAIACKIMRSLCGANWHAVEIRLSRHQPPNLEPYRNFFDAPLRFDSDQNAVVFPTHWLRHPISSADPLLHRHLEREADALHARKNRGIVRELRRLLRKSLATKQYSAADIAKQLNLHERTLNRRLNEEGTNFRNELQIIRYDVARQLLGNSGMPLSRIATSLGYSDATAFIRAFKLWSGTSPAEWRRTHSSLALEHGRSTVID